MGDTYIGEFLALFCCDSCDKRNRKGTCDFAADANKKRPHGGATF